MMKKTKWWVAFANTQNEIDEGAYKIFNCRSRRHARTAASRLMSHGAIVTYINKYQRVTVICVTGLTA